MLTLPPDTGEAAVSWLQTKLRGVAGGQLGVTTRYRYRYRCRYVDMLYKFRYLDISIISMTTRSLSLSSSRFKLAHCWAFQITASYPA